ncbi:cilia- and flagella-associated protein 157-like [Diaphorina citri]|uniref:Cilia- and flagella-associated protein 157 n=1 Tax=Diaphorina citri TaxID=121845 RepID=A0A3Q0ISI9_DIACI|nr:cilia- and flagella-associated protein 157-like [Diaphorina citri]
MLIQREGKLNSLEEFRQAKEELMRKFQEQEEKFQQQEKRHDDQLYEVEKQYMLDRDRLQKELEKRLLQLSADFRPHSNLRILMLDLKENYMKMKQSYAQITAFENQNAALSEQVDHWKAKHNQAYSQLTKLSEQMKEQSQKTRHNLRKQQVMQRRVVLKKQRLMLDLKENYMKMKESYAQITAFENQNAALSEQVNHWKAKHNQAYSQLTKLSEQLKEQSQKTRQEDVALHSTKHELDKLQRIVHQAATAIKHTVEVSQSEVCRTGS